MVGILRGSCPSAQIALSVIRRVYDVRFIARNGCEYSLGSRIWWLYFHALFRLILVHAHTSVHCLILPLFPSICWSAVEHILLSCPFMYCSLAITGYVGIMRSIVPSFCWHSLHLLSPFSIFSLHGIWFVARDPQLLLFHFEFLLSDVPMTAIGTCLVRWWTVYLYIWYTFHALLKLFLFFF